MKQIVYCEIRNNKILNNRQTLQAIIEGFNNENIKITIESTDERSLKQNNLYWFYVDIIRKEIGYSKNECHEILKYKFLLTEKADEKTGEIMQYVRSTTDLTKNEYVDFIDSIIQWSFEYLKVELPMPLEQQKIKV